jgi:hypothetical protein
MAHAPSRQSTPDVSSFDVEFRGSDVEGDAACCERNCDLPCGVHSQVNLERTAPPTVFNASIDLPDGTPRIDYLGGISTGYGNRPYQGSTAFVRLLCLF